MKEDGVGGRLLERVLKASVCCQKLLTNPTHNDEPPFFTLAHFSTNIISAAQQRTMCMVLMSKQDFCSDWAEEHLFPLTQVEIQLYWFVSNLPAWKQMSNLEFEDECSFKEAFRRPSWWLVSILINACQSPLVRFLPSADNAGIIFPHVALTFAGLLIYRSAILADSTQFEADSDPLGLARWDQWAQNWSKWIRPTYRWARGMVLKMNITDFINVNQYRGKIAFASPGLFRYSWFIANPN